MPLLDGLGPSAETVVTRPFEEPQARASSAPTPKKEKYHHLDVVGRDLSKPLGRDDQQDVGRGRTSQRPFLSQQRVECIENGSPRMIVKRPDLEKSLPCLPMNDFQSQSARRRSPQYHRQTSNQLMPSKVTSQTKRPQGPREDISAQARNQSSEARIPTRHYHQFRDLKVQKRNGRLIMPIPFYDNPPREMDLSGARRGQVKGPRIMPSRSLGEVDLSETAQHGNPHTIRTSTTATISGLTSQSAIQHSDGGGLSDTNPSQQRPLLPQRLNETTKVPRLTQTDGRRRIANGHYNSTAMIAPRPKYQTQQTIVERRVSPLRPTRGNLIAHRPLQEEFDDLQPHAQDAGRLQNLSLAFQIQTCGSSPPRTPGSHPTSVHRREVETGAMVYKEGIPDVQSIIERNAFRNVDHGRCCEVCCADDIHESCMGHPTPVEDIASNPFEASAQRFRKRGVCNSVRLQRTTRTRTFVDGSTEIEDEEVAELETPDEAEWEKAASVPLLPAKMQRWGSPRSSRSRSPSPGAIAAARRAMLAKQGPRNHKMSGDSVTEANKLKAGLAAESSSRSASGASLLSLSNTRYFDVPGLDIVGVVLEMLLVPLKACKMWFKNHPELQQYLLTFGRRLLDMSRCVLATTCTLYKLAYIYSKTGIMETKSTSVPALLRDCVRSLVYLIVLLAVAAATARAFGWIIFISSSALWPLKKIGLAI